MKALRLQHEEARTVLDHHVRLAADIEDKAMRTVRVEVLLVAALLTTAQVVGPESPFVNTATKLGSGFLVLSLVTGIVTYAYSSPDFGPGPRYNDEIVANQHSEHEWLSVLLTDYADWIERTERITYRHGLFLSVCQTTLICGLLLLAIGVFPQLH